MMESILESIALNSLLTNVYENTRLDFFEFF